MNMMQIQKAILGQLTLYDALLISQSVVPCILGLMMMIIPHTVMEIFGEQKYYADATTEIALDLWRLLGCMLLLFGAISYGIFLLDDSSRRKLAPFLFLGGGVLTCMQVWIQLSGRWNNYRIIAPAMEGLMVIMHAREWMESSSSSTRKL